MLIQKVCSIIIEGVFTKFIQLCKIIQIIKIDYHESKYLLKSI